MTFVNDSTFFESSDGSKYANGGTEGVNVFRLDTGLNPYTPLVRFLNGSCFSNQDSDPTTSPEDQPIKKLSGLEQFAISFFSTVAGSIFAVLIFSILV